jgi:hypothetical protein
MLGQNLGKYWRSCMKTCKWMVLVATSGLLFGIGACATQIGQVVIGYLPDLLNAILGSVSTTA